MCFLKLTFVLYYRKEKKPEKTQLTIDVRTALTESSSSGLYFSYSI